MKLPTIEGVIDRRVLVNFRVEPRTMAALLPSPLRPQLVEGWAIAGICLIRLQDLRPAGMPPWAGLRSENAAHRVAVEWDDEGVIRTGVFIPRRDSSSRLNAAFGGRLFPGVHHRAHFDVSESEDVVEVQMRSTDKSVIVAVRGRKSSRMPDGSVFGTVDRASAFFEAGALGLSPARRSNRLEALELDVLDWSADALAIDDVYSSFFSDTTRFPVGTIQIDNALLMRGIRHRWHQREPLSGIEDRAAAYVGPGVSWRPWSCAAPGFRHAGLGASWIAAHGRLADRGACFEVRLSPELAMVVSGLIVARPAAASYELDARRGRDVVVGVPGDAAVVVVPGSVDGPRPGRAQRLSAGGETVVGSGESTATVMTMSFWPA